MSKINELIQTLCPDGVEYKLFGDVASICRGASPRPIKQFVTEDVNGVNWIKIGDTNVGSKYITETAERITEAGAKKSRYVHIGDFIMSNSMSFGRPYICQIEGCIHDGWLAISEFHDSYNSDFLYYLLCSTVVQKMMEKKAFNGGAVSNLNADIVRALELPVPPLPVQEEIVRILDEYTDLEAELEAKLSEEIELKQKQYEFYMDKLLTFGDDVERKKLGEVCILSAGGDAPKTNMSKIKSDEYKYPIYSNGIGDNALYGYTDEYKISSPCVTVAARGTIGWAALRMEPFYPIVRLICVLPNDYDELNVSFLKYFIDIMEFPVPEGGIPQLTVPMLKNREIPIPSLTEQERIVKILDKYDTYTRDMISTLNIELESRKKQYAYYRDQLLTFKRKE